jgi:hypothetical protein
MIRTLGITALFTSLGACGLECQAPHSRATDSLVPGTYVVRICQAPCDPRADSTLVVTGTVVLLAHPLGRHLLPSRINEDYYHRYRNACFVFDEKPREGGTFAGYSRAGVVGWDRDPEDSLVQFSLYWSPDARYWVKVSLRGGHLVGHGGSQGLYVGRGHPVDSVYGERVGPANEATCIAAAKAEHP